MFWNRTALIAKVDDGAAGNAVYLDLVSEGVDTSQIVRDCKSKSTTAFVAIDAEGGHRFFLSKGKNEGIALEEIDLLTLKKARAISRAACIPPMYLDKGRSYRTDEDRQRSRHPHICGYGP